MIEQAGISEHLRNILPEADIIRKDFDQLESHEQLYDAVFSFHVIEHVPDILKHLEKAHSIAKKGGLLFLATPNVDSIQHKLPFSLSPHLIVLTYFCFHANL